MPVYNDEKEIARCLNSIIKQSFSDIEIIVVDDGSTDLSGDICDEYGQKDSRIKVIHVNHGGVSYARNQGLNLASGEYIFFVDSDDVISKNAIHILVDLILGYDMAFAGHIIYDVTGKETTKWIDKYMQPHVWDRAEALMLMFDSSALKKRKREYCYVGYCVNKLYIREIIERNRIRFDEDIYFNEDRQFVVNYLLECGNIISTHEITYKYLQNPDGVTQRKGFKESNYYLKEKTEFEAFDRMMAMLEDSDAYYACIYNAYKRAVKFKYVNYSFDNRLNKLALEMNRKYGNLMIENKRHYKLLYLIPAKYSSMRK